MPKKILLWLVFLCISFCSLSEDTVAIRCFVRCENSEIGNAQIIFTDSTNNEHKFVSDIFGESLIRLPKGKYKVTASRTGYLPVDKYAEAIDFSQHNNYNYYLYLKKKDNSSNSRSTYIQGTVYDEDSNGIADAQLTLRSTNKTYKLKTDEYGSFHKEISSGIFTILCQKNGFIDGGTARKAIADDSVTNIEITLKKERYIVEGIITDGTKALPSIPIVLYDQDLNKIGETVSDALGHYEFLDIQGHKFIFLSVTHDDYQRYRTDMTELTKTDNFINVILDIK